MVGRQSSPFTLSFENKHSGSFSGDIALDFITMKSCDAKASCNGLSRKKLVHLNCFISSLISP